MQPSNEKFGWPNNVPADITAKELESRKGKEKRGGTEFMSEMITQGGEEGMREQEAKEDSKPKPSHEPNQ